MLLALLELSGSTVTADAMGYRKGEGRERYTWIGPRLRIFMDGNGSPQSDGSPQEEAGTSTALRIMQGLTRDDGDELETPW